MLLKDQFARLANEYQKVEKLIEEKDRIESEMAIIKSKFNRLDAIGMEEAMSSYDTYYERIPYLVEKIEAFQSKIYALGDKFDVDSVDGYDSKTHKIILKNMKKQIKDAYSKEVETQYEEDEEREIGIDEVDAQQSKKGILGQFNAIKRKIHKK